VSGYQHCFSGRQATTDRERHIVVGARLLDAWQSILAAAANESTNRIGPTRFLSANRGWGIHGERPKIDPDGISATTIKKVSNVSKLTLCVILPSRDSQPTLVILRREALRARARQRDSNVVQT
jgi:hypothetical protein